MSSVEPNGSAIMNHDQDPIEQDAVHQDAIERDPPGEQEQDQGDSPSQSATTRLFTEEELDPRVAEILDNYFDQLQNGNAPSQESILAAHPDIADQLRACLEGIHLVNAAPADAAVRLGELKQLGDFRILREVGRGGMGVVYEAEQISLKRRVALKVLRFGVADREAMERFRREAETVAKLHHSNIVPIYAVGECDGVNYFAMQFIDGMSLAEVQREANPSSDVSNPLDAMDIADWGLQAAEALAYAHEHEVIHRDVKPSNLIRDEQGRVWLTDFGLAKRLDDVSLSMTGAILGTPRYMSPEQASSVRLPVDHRTDIYSLGATLYELATNKPLFDAQSPHVALGQIISDEPVAPRTIRPKLSRDLETIIMRCLSKDAQHRYESASELSHDLRAYIDGRAIQARRPTWVELLGRWLQKNQRIVGAATTTAAVVSLIIVGALFGVREYRQSKLGHLQFETSQQRTAPLIAEVLDSNGSHVIPSFTVPTQNPVAIPEGDYRLRLTAVGELSETSNLVVEASGGKVRANIPDRAMWKPKDAQGHWETWSRADGDDFVVFDPGGITLLDGGTGDTVWEADLEDAIKKGEIQAPMRDWWKPNDVGKLPQDRGYAFVLNADVDLNADGVGDLVLSHRYRPWIVALSGADGNLLWQYSAFSLHDPTQNAQNARGGTFAAPLAANVDDDEIPDLIGSFVVVDRRWKNIRKFLRCLSGATGDVLWEKEIDVTYCDACSRRPKVQPNSHPPVAARWYCDGWFDQFSSPGFRENGTYGFEDNTDFGGGEWIWVPYAPEFLPESKQQEIVVFAGQHVIRLDTKSGEQITLCKIAETPIRAPQWLDANGDGEMELLTFTRISGSKALNQTVTATSMARTRLTLWDVKHWEPIWTADGRADWEWLLKHEELANDARSWPLVDDLEQDGTLEIVLPGDYRNDRWRGTPWGKVQVLDASTGKQKWSSEAIINMENQINHMLTVRDVDGDGVRDVASVTPYRGPEPGKDRFKTDAYIFVDVLSGANGKPLGRIRSNSIGRNRPASILNVQLEKDILLVDLRASEDFPDRPDQVILFDLRKGELESVSEQVQRGTFADLNEDAVPELVCWRPGTRRDPAQGGQLYAWQLNDLLSLAGGAWNHTDKQFVAAGDVDGDGIGDAISDPRRGNDREVRMVSGQSGKLLWRWTNANNNENIVPLKHDLNGDGCPDVLLGINTKLRPELPLCYALSGRTGGRLWKCDLLGGTSFGQLLSVSDLDSDGRDELLLVAQCRFGAKAPGGSFKDPLWLFCIDAKSGELQWKSLVSESARGLHLLKERYAFELVDANKDGVLDIVGYAGQVKPETLKLSAWNGKNGELVWAKGMGEFSSKVPAVQAGDFTSYPHFCSIKNAKPKVIVTHARREPFVVQAINGETGATDWEWDGEDRYFRTGTHLPSQRYGNPVPVEFRLPAGNSVGFLCKRATKKAEPNAMAINWPTLDLVLLDVESGDENLTHTIDRYSAMPPESSWFDYRNKTRLWAEDFDGDGFDEAIYTTTSHLVVYSLTKSTSLWEFEIPNAWHRLVSVERLADGQMRILLETWLEEGNSKSGKQLVMLDGQGKKRWSDEVPETLYQYPIFDICDVLPGTAGAPDKLLYRNPGRRTVMCRAATEQYQTLAMSLPSRKTNVAADLEKTDPRLIRHFAFSESPSLISMLHSIILSLAVIVVPGYFLFRLAKGRWSLKTLFVLPVILGIFILAIRWPNPTHDIQSVDIGRNFLTALTTAFIYLPFIVLTAVTISLVKQSKWRSIALIVIGFLLMSALCVVMELASSGYFSEPFQIRHTWYGWWWVLLGGLQIVAVLVMSRAVYDIVARRFPTRSATTAL